MTTLDFQLSPEAWAFAMRPGLGAGRVVVVWRERSGCVGDRFGLRRTETLPEGHATQEIQLDDGPAWLAIAPQDLPHLQGTRITLERQGLNIQLTWHNPQEISRCGCGQSVVTRSSASNQSSP